jgi:hypothetical protein
MSRHSIGGTGEITIETLENPPMVVISMTFKTQEDAERAGAEFSRAAKTGVLELRIHTGAELKAH